MNGVVVPLRPPSEAEPPFSDEALVSACGAGEAAALGALFDRFQRRTFRFVSRLIGSEDLDVDDVVQATFLEVWRSAPRFKARSSVLTWILGIAANLARHHVRAERRRSAALVSVASLPISGGASPDIVANRHQLIVRLGRELDALPHPLREAFVLCDVEEIPSVEAAKALGVRQGTLWRRLHEARRKLRAALEPEAT